MNITELAALVTIHDYLVRSGVTGPEAAALAVRIEAETKALGERQQKEIDDAKRHSR
jgi:hypothetical protein